MRAIFCFGIVIWHSTAFNFITEPVLNYFFVYYYALLGVPIFFQISLFLYSQKIIQFGNSKSYFFKRIKHLTFIYFFWLLINWFLLGNIAEIGTNAKTIAYFLLGNGTQLYYLCSLVILTTVSLGVLFFYRFGAKISRQIYSITVIGLFIFSLYLMIIGFWIFSTQLNFPLGYANPFNFFPYVFSSIILAISCKNPSADGRVESRRLNGVLLIIFLSSTIAFGILEGLAYEQNWSLNGFTYLEHVYYSYARTSLVFLTMSLILITVKIKRKPPKVVSIISDLSLGIYVTHEIVLYFVNKVINSLFLIIHPFLIACITFLCAMMITYFLKNYAKKLF